MKRLFCLCSLALFASCLLADVTYEEMTKYTGGALLDAIHAMANNPILGRLAGGKLGNAFADHTSTVYIKGPKMAVTGSMLSVIYDLDAGTITTVDHQKRTYTVQTFQEMREQLQRAQERAARGQHPNIDFDTKVDKTGKTRNINGQTASETVLTLTAKSTDPNDRGQMVVKADYWLVPLGPGMQEAVDYHKRLAAKYGAVFAGSPMLGGASAGINAALQQSLAFDGYPAITDVSVTGVSSPLVRNSSDSNQPLIQMEIQSADFATGAVDDSKLAVPAGYKEQSSRH